MRLIISSLFAIFLNVVASIIYDIGKGHFTNNQLAKVDSGKTSPEKGEIFAGELADYSF
jgi:hypothetical protein